MTSPTFLDTNVLLYAIDADEPAKRGRALEVLAATPDPVISTQVLGEFYIAATHRLRTPLSSDDAQARIEELAGIPVVPLTAGLVWTAIDLSSTARISYWDAAIIAAAASAGCRVVLSEDLHHGATLGGVRVENPFRARGSPGPR